MKGVLTPAKFASVAIVWLSIAIGVFIVSMSVSGKVGTRGIDASWPSKVIMLELRGHGIIAPAVESPEESAAFDALEQRLPRLLAAGMVGFALAGAGVTLQALLRNPLADPYVLGISSGSAVGVMAWMVILAAAPAWAMTAPPFLLASGRALPAVIGAVITCILVFVLSRGRWAGGTEAGIQPITLLLVGIVVSAMNAAVLMVLNAIAPHGLRADLATYLLGAISENELTHSLLWAAAIVLFAGYLPVLFASPALNVGSLSDVEAISLGVNVHRLRTLCFVCASVMTAAAILLSGPIGFVGLICPHICRRIIGADHRKLAIAAPLCGAAFLMAADSAVRVAVTLNHGELPVGVVTALCGGPFFLFLLRRR